MCEPGRVFVLGDFLQNKKTVIYGAGSTGRKLYDQLIGKGIEVVAVVDKNADSLEKTFFCPLITPESFFITIFHMILFLLLMYQQQQKVRSGNI